MAKKAKEDENVYLEDVVFTNSVTIAAIIKTLEKKGIVTSDEIIESIEELEDVEIEELFEEKISPIPPKKNTPAAKKPSAKAKAVKKAKPAPAKKAVKPAVKAKVAAKPKAAVKTKTTAKPKAAAKTKSNSKTKKK